MLRKFTQSCLNLSQECLELGAAVKMIKSIAPEVYDINTLQDDYELAQSFIFSKTPQGSDYWWKVSALLGQNPTNI